LRARHVLIGLLGLELLVFLVIVVGIALGHMLEPSTATPPTDSPTIVAASVAPTVVASTSTPLSTPRTGTAARPGLISRNGDAPIVIRTETDATGIRTWPTFGVVSPDGSRMAYGTQTAGSAEFHVLDFGGTDRVVATIADRRPGAVAWSTDGTGLVVVVVQTTDPTPIVMAIEIASGAGREVYRGIGPSGASVVPLVWRRSPEIFAVYETGPGGYSFGYTVIRPGQAPVRTDPSSDLGDVLGMVASSDGSYVAGLWLRENVIKVWPVDDFSKQTQLTPVASEQFSSPRWWPGRTEIAYAAARLADGLWRDTRIERWDPRSGVRTIVKRLPDAGSIGTFLIRADGSGLLTQGPYPPGAWEATDLRSGITSVVPQISGENILRTIVITSTP